MVTIRLESDSTAPAADVLAAGWDFSERRERIWPNVSLKRMTVHELGETTADVTEGSLSLGVWWERCDYDWSQPGVVMARVKDSNVYLPGTSSFELRATDGDGGSHVEMTYTREFTSTPKGIAAKLFYRTAGPPLFRSMIKAILAEIEKDLAERA